MIFGVPCFSGRIGIFLISFGLIWKSPKTRQRPKYPWDQIPVVTKTSMNDGRGPYENPYTNFSTIVHWASDETSGRPPVVWAIRPVNACDYAALAGCDESELPELLRLSGKLDRFCRRYQNILPRDMSDILGAAWSWAFRPDLRQACRLLLRS